MNAKVAFDANVTGIRNISAQQRIAAAQQVSANSQAKASAYAAKAGLVTKAETSTTTRTTKELDRDAFLQLLVLQMQNQDPLEPMDNTDMIAQLAQFSTLEQMNNLTKSFDTLSNNVDQLSFLSASALVGRTVTGLDSSGASVSGTIEGVVLDKGTVYFTVDGQWIPMANVKQVK